MVAALSLLAISIACYSVREVYFQGKLKWESKPTGFWGKMSYLRKYKLPTEPAPDNWYYRFNNLAYKELFPLSGTLLVWTTDGPHCFQLLLFTLLSLSFTVALGFNWWLFAGLFIGIRLAHFLYRKLFSK